LIIVFKTTLSVDPPGRSPYLTGLTAWEHWTELYPEEGEILEEEEVTSEEEEEKEEVVEKDGNEEEEIVSNKDMEHSVIVVARQR
jgi:hypothetical protein